MIFTSAGQEFITKHPESLNDKIPVRSDDLTNPAGLIPRLLDPRTGFLTFLHFWKFVDRDTGKQKLLGDVLWPGQLIYVKEMSDTLAWLFLLKARQLGLSTLETAFDAWAFRFRPSPAEEWWKPDAANGANATVHIFSKREKDAQAFLAQVKYGLERLPDWMQLPVQTDNAGEYVWRAGADDIRTLRAFPADSDTSRSYTCTHAHMDEWAFMGDPARVLQSVQESAAGTMHFITTGNGPQNFTSQYWRRCVDGLVLDRRGTPVKPIFLHALLRPDRSESWLQSRAAGMTVEARRQELPMTAEEAISGGGDYIFRSQDIDACGIDYLGLMPARKTRSVWDLITSTVKRSRTKYVTAWDIGRHGDAAVGIVLDVTEEVHDVVCFHHVRELQYPHLQALIERTYEEYGGVLVIEKNNAGGAVAENLKIPERHIIQFNTTRTSKPLMLNQLRIATQKQTLKWDPSPDACQILDTEMRGYQLPDDNLTQDTVMSLAIAEHHAPAALMGGRVMGVIEV